MVLPSPNSQVFDEIRNLWVAATPEEIVRQTLVKRMIQQLGYPKQQMAVERELASLPHLTPQKVPSRRIDILCFSKELFPLLIIECKKEKIDASALEQLLGYNSFVGAPFVAVAGKEEIAFHFRDTTLPFLPPYTQLLDALSHG